jgi:transcriptional regulator with XRE-family HTH domain
MLYMSKEWYQRITARREELRMTIPELARAAGLSRPTLVGIESGDVRSSRYVTLEAIAKALNWRVADIFRDDVAHSDPGDDEALAAVAARSGVDFDLLRDVLALLKALGPVEARRWIGLIEFDAGLKRRAGSGHEEGKADKRAEYGEA